MDLSMIDVTDIPNAALGDVVTIYGSDHGAGDTLAAATACALAHGYTVPDAVSFAKGWVTECLRAAYPLGHGHGPVSPLFRLS